MRLLLVGALVVAGCGADAVAPTPIPTATPATLPEDVNRLGLALAPVNGSARLDEAAALDVAARVAPHVQIDSASRNAYFVTATDPSSVGPGGFVQRPIWLVRYAGLALHFPGPAMPDGGQTEGHTAHFMYVLIDEMTGEAIDIQYWE